MLSMPHASVDRERDAVRGRPGGLQVEICIFEITRKRCHWEGVVGWFDNPDAKDNSNLFAICLKFI